MPFRARIGSRQPDSTIGCLARCGGLQTDLRGYAEIRPQRLHFDRSVEPTFHGLVISSDDGLRLYRELDDVLGLGDLAMRLLAILAPARTAAVTAASWCAGRTSRDWRCRKASTPPTVAIFLRTLVCPWPCGPGRCPSSASVRSSPPPASCGPGATGFSRWPQQRFRTGAQRHHRPLQCHYSPPAFAASARSRERRLMAANAGSKGQGWPSQPRIGVAIPRL